LKKNQSKPSKTVSIITQTKQHSENANQNPKKSFAVSLVPENPNSMLRGYGTEGDHEKHPTQQKDSVNPLSKSSITVPDIRSSTTIQSRFGSSSGDYAELPSRLYHSILRKLNRSQGIPKHGDKPNISQKQDDYILPKLQSSGTSGNSETPYHLYLSNVHPEKEAEAEVEEEAEKEEDRISPIEEDELASVLTGVTFARPKIDEIFKQKLEEYKQNPISKNIGVFFCGPPVLGVDIEKACKNFSKDRIKFHFHKENF